VLRREVHVLGRVSASFAVLAMAAGCEIRFGSGGRGGCEDCDLENAESSCVDDECRLSSCDRGYGNCNFEQRDGCESRLLEDDRHCGACGNFCPTGCRAGVCGTVETVATGPASYAMLLELDDEFVYWTGVSSTFDGSLWRAAKAGGALQELAPTRETVVALKAQGDHLYWLESDHDAPAYVFRRVPKQGSIGSVEDLGWGRGTVAAALVLHEDFAYLDVHVEDGDVDRLVRVPRAGGEPEPVPDQAGTGIIFGLQPNGRNVMFGLRSSGRDGAPALVEYRPDLGTFVVLAPRFPHSTFAPAGSEVFVKIYYGGAPLPRLARFALPGGTLREIGLAPTEFQDIMVAGESFLLVDAIRGGLSRLRPPDRIGAMIAGEQQGLVSAVFDESFVYFGSRGEVRRVPR
jgi:hypothetical protein